MLRLKIFAGAALLAGAAVILAQETSWLKGSTDEKLKTLADIQPGLGTVMAEYSARAGNVYYAVRAGNWGFAAYQLNEMTEIQEVAENTRPGRAKQLRSGFIVYSLPDRPASPVKMDAGMKVSKADLQKLLGDLVK